MSFHLGRDIDIECVEDLHRRVGEVDDLRRELTMLMCWCVLNGVHSLKGHVFLSG
jgi:hypothetical protein